MRLLYEGLSLEIPAGVTLEIEKIHEIPTIFIDPSNFDCWKRPYAKDLVHRLDTIVDEHLGTACLSFSLSSFLFLSLLLLP